MEVKILNGRTHFYQWDSEQKFIVDDADVNELHFTNNAQEDASVVSCYEQEGIKLCDIPNSYLEKNGILTVYAFTYENGNYTKNTFRFNVIERPKPNDYVVEEEEKQRWGELDNKINLTKDELENEIDELDKAKANAIHNHDADYDAKGSSSEALTNAKAYTDEVCNTKAQKNHGHIINEVNGLQTALDEKAYKTHSHMDLSTRITEVEQGKANVYHVHSEYYGKTSVDNLLKEKADKNHTHDDKYYPKEVIDEKLSKVDANVSEEDIANAVEDYLAENPIEIPSDVVTKEEFEAKQPFKVSFGTHTRYEDGNPVETYWACSKKTDEIYDAWINGRDIIGYNSQSTYALSYCTPTEAKFYRITSKNVVCGFDIEKDNKVTYYSYYIQVENPSGLETKETSIVGAINELKGSIDDTNTKIDDVNGRIINHEWVAKPNYKIGELIHEETIEFRNSIDCEITSTFANQLQIGKTYRVIWDGVEYDTKVYGIAIDGAIFKAFGNIARFYPGYMDVVGEVEDTGEPFAYVFVLDGDNPVMNEFTKSYDADETVEFEIYECEEKPNPIPNKFLPSHLQFGGDEYTTDEFVLDENSNDYEIVFLEDVAGVKITDYIPTVEQLIGGTIGLNEMGNYVEYQITEEDIQDMRVDGVPMLMVGDGLIIVYEDNAMMGVAVTKGIWFMVTDYFHISKLKLTETITVGEIKKLDSKYLPTFGSKEIENVLVEQGEYVVNNEEMGVQAFAFGGVPTKNNDQLTVSWNGTEYKYHTLTTIQYNENTTWHTFGNIGAMNETLGTNYPITNEPFIGVYVEFTDGSQQNIVIVPLDGSTSANISVYQEKENNLLIQSPNGNIFKVMVDENGMLYTVDDKGNSYKTINGNEVAY